MAEDSSTPTLIAPSSQEDVLNTLLEPDPKLHVVITGRDAPEALIAYADLVTEMREIKHPYKLQEVRAQKGFEF